MGNIGNYLIVITGYALVDFVTVLAFCAIIFGLERALPRGEQAPLSLRLRILRFSFLYILFAAAFRIVIGIPHVEPVITLEGVALTIAAVLVGDFAFYAMHRLQHAVPFLWRLHKVHHSPEELGAGTAFNHPLLLFTEIAIITIPIMLIAPNAPGVGAAISFWVIYGHSTTMLNLGPLRWVVADNQAHRIHHSREPRHYDKNFGFPFLIWDHVFRTAYIPKKDEWPTVGLDDFPSPQNEWEYLTTLPAKRSASSPSPLQQSR